MKIETKQSIEIKQSIDEILFNLHKRIFENEFFDSNRFEDFHRMIEYYDEEGFDVTYYRYYRDLYRNSGIL